MLTYLSSSRSHGYLSSITYMREWYTRVACAITQHSDTFVRIAVWLVGWASRPIAQHAARRPHTHDFDQDANKISSVAESRKEKRCRRESLPGLKLRFASLQIASCSSKCWVKIVLHAQICHGMHGLHIYRKMRVIPFVL